jgi:hypothetical protein
VNNAAPPRVTTACNGFIAMKRNLDSFNCGALFAVAVGCSLLLWDSRHEYRALNWLEGTDEASITLPPKAELQTEDLVGTWRGHESFGYIFVIKRAGDGTFTEVSDIRRSDLYPSSNDPFYAKSKGRWSLHGKMYSFYYTESTNADFLKYGPWAAEISPDSQTEFSYMIDQGNGVLETKE